MQYTFTTEQREFRAVLRRFFGQTSPPSVARRLMDTDTGWDTALWRDLNTQLGVSGDTVAALAFTEPNGQWDQDGIETTAHPAAGRYRLSGVKSFVIDGHTADL